MFSNNRIWKLQQDETAQAIAANTVTTQVFTTDPISLPPSFGITWSNLEQRAFAGIEPELEHGKKEKIPTLVATPVTVPDMANEMVKLAQKAEALLGYSVFRKALKAPGALGMALHELEIYVFSDQKVWEYKQSMRHNKQLELDASWKAAVKVTASTPQPGRPIAQWEFVDISDYKEEIPPHVIEVAVQIKEKCPVANVYVDALRVREKSDDPFLLVALGDEQYYVAVWDESTFEAELNK